jgi:hypothetical protein
MMKQARDTATMQHSVLAEIGMALVIFGAAAIVGFLALVALFKIGVMGHVDILFYRGLALCVVVMVLLTGTFWFAGNKTGWCSLRDAMAAGVLSFGLNLAFLIVAPVTVDRSVTVFVTGYMAAHPGEALTVGALQTAFERRYLGEFQQVQRRMDEQVTSGNVAARNGGYVLTEQGQRFIATAKFIGWLFDADPRFVSQKPLQARILGPLKAEAIPGRR